MKIERIKPIAKGTKAEQAREHDKVNGLDLFSPKFNDRVRLDCWLMAASHREREVRSALVEHLRVETSAVLEFDLDYVQTLVSK